MAKNTVIAAFLRSCKAKYKQENLHGQPYPIWCNYRSSLIGERAFYKLIFYKSLAGLKLEYEITLWRHNATHIN